MVDQLDIYFQNDGIHEVQVRQQSATDSISTHIYVNYIHLNIPITRYPILPMATIS